MNRILSISLLWLAYTTLLPTVTSADEPSSLAAKILADTSYSWQHDQSTHFHIHYPKNSYASHRLPTIKRNLEDAFTLAISLLDTTGYDHRIDVFYIDRRADMVHLVDSRASGLTFVGEHTVILVYNPIWRPFERHEVLHVLQENTWGAGPEPYGWFREGLAIHADGFCGPYTIGELGAKLLQEDRLLHLEDLIFHFDAQDEVVRGIEAGSFLEFLYQRYDISQVRKLWTLGAQNIEQALGASMGTIDAMYREYLKSIPLDDIPIDWITFSDKGCG